MKLFEVSVIGIGLAMDAFAVSVCKGLSMKKINYKKDLFVEEDHEKENNLTAVYHI